MSGDLYIVEDLWCVSAAEFSIRMSGLKATVKATCKEVQPSVFLATSTSMSCEIKMMGFSAEASYLAAVHYTNVEVAGRQQVMNGASDASTETKQEAAETCKADRRTVDEGGLDFERSL